MVDINLIGDDKGEEKEEHLDDFTHTSSMDTQELTFEERTETFDTTKTAGYTLKRGYSSLVSTLIILGVVILLGAAVYFFLFSGDRRTGQANLPTIKGKVDESVETVPAETQEPEVSTSITESESEANIEPEPELESGAEKGVETMPSSMPSSRESLEPLASRILTTSRSAIQTVTDVMSMIPSNVNTTLLSYAGKRMRLEFVASTASQAQAFTNLLTQSFGPGNFTVLSESQVASNGKSFEKVLLAGSIASDGRALSTGRVEFMNPEQAKNWVQNTSNQYGLQIRQFQSHQGTFVDGYLKTPILIRIFGSKSSVVGFLEEIAVEGLNVEITKILLVSPDMISFSDETLMLVLSLFLYQPS
ncbi:MAG: archaellin/type IV pilin N-terminal domain-containing protein [bacterium]